MKRFVPERATEMRKIGCGGCWSAMVIFAPTDQLDWTLLLQEELAVASSIVADGLLSIFFKQDVGTDASMTRQAQPVTENPSAL